MRGAAYTYDATHSVASPPDNTPARNGALSNLRLLVTWPRITKPLKSRLLAIYG